MPLASINGVSSASKSRQMNAMRVVSTIMYDAIETAAPAWRQLPKLLLASLLAMGAMHGAHAALTLTSIDAPGRIGRGQTVDITVNYTRASGAGNEAVTVEVPALLSVEAPLPSSCGLVGAVGSPQTLTCAAVDPGAPGSSGSFTFKAQGRSLGGGNLQASTDGPPVSNVSDSFTVVSGGDLSIVKTMAPSTTLINGQTATFTLTAALTGDSVPAGSVITVSDQLPGTAAEFQLTSVTAPGYSCNSVAAANASRVLTCTITGPLTSLPVVTVQGRPTLTGSGGLQNTGLVSPDGLSYIDNALNNNKSDLAFTINPGADPRPVGDFPGQVVTSTAQTLTVSYVNNGPQSITGGQLSVAIPPGFVVGTLPAGCVAAGVGTVNGVAGNVFTCTANTVTSGGQQAFAFALTTPATAQIGNFGVQVLTGAGGALPGGLTDSDVSNNNTLVPYVIVAPYADLYLTKNKTPGPLPAGAAMVSYIAVANYGISPAVYSAGNGATPLRVVDTMDNREEFVSAPTGWTCFDGGLNSGGPGLRRVVCTLNAAGTLAVGQTITLDLNTKVADTLAAPVLLNNTACSGGQALTLLGLPSTAGPQPPDGNQQGGSDCATVGTIGTPVISGQAQAWVVKESSRDGVTWVDAVGSPPTVGAADNAMFWRITIQTPTTAVNSAQGTIPTLNLNDSLPAILNVASPGTGVPAWVTPAASVTTTVTGGAAGSCPASVAAGSSSLACAFTSVPPGSNIEVVIRVDRPFEDGTFTNTASLSSPDAILTAAAGKALSDDAALIVQGRTDPAITSKTVSPLNTTTEPRIGQNISYTILARNLGPNRLNGPLTVTDVIDPTRVAITGATAIGSGSSPTMTCSVVPGTGTVTCATPAGSSVARHDFYTVVINARPIKPGGALPPSGTVGAPFVNTATVSLDQAQNCEFTPGPSAACNDVASRVNNANSVSIDIKVPLIDVSQKKSRVLPTGQTNFLLGDILRYRFRSQNNGPSRAEGIQMTDKLSVPAGFNMTFQSVAAVNSVAAEGGFTLDSSKTAATVSCAQAGANANVVCSLASVVADNYLDAATEVNYELTFTLTGPSVVAAVGNSARICADETTGYESSGSCSFTPALAGNNIASVNDLIFPKTDLAISKTRITPNPVGINQPVQYALALQNLGPSDTTQIRFTDQLPVDFEWVTGTVGGVNYTPSAAVGGFAGLAVSALNCSASPAAITAPGQQQTISCIVDGTLPGNAAANNTVTATLFARPKAGIYSGPYLSDRNNNATVTPGLDSSGQALSVDTQQNNNSALATTQVQTASLAGTVFEDRDRAGADGGTPQAAGVEPRISGVSIVLTGTDAYGFPVSRSATTDDSGNYSFADLPPSSPAGYTVTETQPANTINSPSAPPATGANAPSVGGIYTAAPTATTSTYTGVVLSLGTAATRYNFPELRRVNLSGFVYIDANANGVRDTGANADPAIAGASVRLLNATTGALVATATTLANGSYGFANLDPLVPYTLEEPLPTAPAGLVNGAVNPGLINGAACAAGCTAQPNTPVSNTDRITAIDLSAGVDGTQFNFGETIQSFIGGRVWLDLNNNGLIDGSEVGIAGVIIELSGTDSNGNTVTRQATTDDNGAYGFSQMPPGSYSLREPAQPAGTANGITVPGSTGGLATLPAVTPSVLSNVTLAPNANSVNNNFGEIPAGSIGGRVYRDSNNNGTPDTGESGFVGVTLVLSGTDDLGNVVSATTVTAADGSYSFNGLRPGTYAVTEPTQPAGSVNGITTAGSLGGQASAPAVTPSVISAINLPLGGRSVDNNFGETDSSPDLRVSKRLAGSRFTVGVPGTYLINVRNVGVLPSSGTYTVSDRLPAGLTLAATPTGTGWTCVGAVGASSFSCDSSTVVAAAGSNANAISATVLVAASASAQSPVDNVVLVDGGGETDNRRPTQAERDAFNGNPAALPVCTPAIDHNACRTPTPVQLAAAISGTAWLDIGGSARVLDSGDRRLPGWQVEVIDTTTGNIVGRATTAADGTYRIGNLEPGVPLAVRFRDTASGVVYGYPVNGESAPGSSGASCAATPAAGQASSCVGSGNTPALTVVLVAGKDLPQQSIPVDPSGVVYDSALRTPVPGAVVTLAPAGSCAGWNPSTGVVGATLGGYSINGTQISTTVGDNGFYQFLFGPSAPASCTFALTVTPPAAYVFQSAAIPPTAGPLVPPGGTGSVYRVQPQATAPTAPVGTGTTYYLTLNSGSAGANIIHNHIPLDPALPTGIVLSKTGDKAVAEVGDSVRYTITVNVTAGAAPCRG
jgi:large repetitive protein